MTERAARVRIMTLGCKVNQVDSEQIADDLAAFIEKDALTSDGPDGIWREAAKGNDAPEEARDSAMAAAAREIASGPEVVVFNSCTVTAEADRKARKLIRHALSLPSRPTVVVTGCLAAVDPEGLRALGDPVLVEPDKELVAERVSSLLGTSLPAPAPRGTRHRSSSRARVQVKVQDGCDARCAYCIVPEARGKPRSVPAATVLEEVQCLAAAGVGEVVLTGVNIGRYGDGGVRLPELLSAVGETGIPRVRLSSIEPGDVDDELLEVAVELPAFCRHLHVPLQSGCDRTLLAMGRPYDTRTYGDVLARARAALPGLAVTTDVIAGFPGEGAADVAASRAFVEAAGFSRLHVFRYSERRNTPAAARTDQIPPAERASRARELRACGARLAERFATERLGTTCELLVERVLEDEGHRHAEGTTREYLHAIVDDPAARPGDRLLIEITGVGAAGRVTGRLAGPQNGVCAAPAW